MVPHFYVICSIILELLVLTCARLSHASVSKELIFLIARTKTISRTWRSIVSKNIAEVRQIDRLDRKSFLNLVAFIVEVRNFSDSDWLKTGFRRQFFGSSELEV